ncbi:expressed unknown protein [Seminavis robusta]|uniref:BTB domain-containing protein n=1 Tax=Seminavis robusta TaxID=568900 RepID=A0A9N8HDJ1_9STRA|nr:expressed unknown protein [Seminavis robusta]|eukprot:Sro363_g126930.1 n/a (370) ;mRNA; f:49388-50578
MTKIELFDTPVYANYDIPTGIQQDGDVTVELQDGELQCDEMTLLNLGFPANLEFKFKFSDTTKKTFMMMLFVLENIGPLDTSLIMSYRQVDDLIRGFADCELLGGLELCDFPLETTLEELKQAPRSEAWLSPRLLDNSASWLLRSPLWSRILPNSNLQDAPRGDSAIVQFSNSGGVALMYLVEQVLLASRISNIHNDDQPLPNVVLETFESYLTLNTKAFKEYQVDLGCFGAHEPDAFTIVVRSGIDQQQYTASLQFMADRSTFFQKAVAQNELHGKNEKLVLVLPDCKPSTFQKASFFIDKQDLTLLNQWLICLRPCELYEILRFYDTDGFEKQLKLFDVCCARKMAHMNQPSSLAQDLESTISSTAI